MDRNTHQSPRQQGYGSTSSLRNVSLKHTRKHEKRKGGIETRSTAHSFWRTVRPGSADRPRWAARTVRPATADRPRQHRGPSGLLRGPSVKSHRTNRDAPEPRTVRGEHADCPPGTRGSSALCCGPSKTPPNQNSKTRRIETKGEQEHEELPTKRTHADRPPTPGGPSAPYEPNRKKPDLEGQLPQIIIGFPKRLKL
jgi:hypothetical protein